MNIKTITTVDGVNVVDFGSAASRFYWIENLGSTVVYVSGNENIVPDGDNVKVLSAGCGTMVENLGGKVYILGAGKFQITNQGDKFPPFRNAPVADGGVMASGNPVQIDGLQGGVPFSEITVSGKNLIGIAQAKAIIGDSTSGYAISNNATSRTIIQKLQPNTTYHIKKYDSGNRFRILMLNNEPTNAADTTAIQLIYNSDGSMSDYTLSTGEDHLWMALVTHYATSGEAIEPIVQLEYGDTATAYEAPITGRELTVGVSGKNLVQYPYIGQRVQAEGITMVDNGDGSVTVNGRCDTIDATFYMQPITLLPDTGYVLSGCPVGGSIAGYRIQFADNEWKKIYADFGNGTKIRVDKKMTFHQFRIIISKGTVCDNLVFRPQLELGDTATAYEPYHGTDYTITPDSNPYTIPNDIRQQEGLNVVSVSEGKISVTGVRKNAAVKKIWDKIDELTTAIIVSNGETIE